MKPRWMRGETKNHMNISDILGTHARKLTRSRSKEAAQLVN